MCQVDGKATFRPRDLCVVPTVQHDANEMVLLAPLWEPSIEKHLAPYDRGPDRLHAVDLHEMRYVAQWEPLLRRLLLVDESLHRHCGRPMLPKGIRSSCDP